MGVQTEQAWYGPHTLSCGWKWRSANFACAPLQACLIVKSSKYRGEEQTTKGSRVQSRKEASCCFYADTFRSVSMLWSTMGCFIISKQSSCSDTEIQLRLHIGFRCMNLTHNICVDLLVGILGGCTPFVDILEGSKVTPWGLQFEKRLHKMCDL